MCPALAIAAMGVTLALSGLEASRELNEAVHDTGSGPPADRLVALQGNPPGPSGESLSREQGGLCPPVCSGISIPTF